jgi:hypothetical protein
MGDRIDAGASTATPFESVMKAARPAQLRHLRGRTMLRSEQGRFLRAVSLEEGSSAGRGGCLRGEGASRRRKAS